MATRDLTVDGTTYSIAEQGEDPTWGEVLVNLLEAMVDKLALTTPTGDILTTSFTVSNTATTATDVTNLSFDPTSVRSAKIFYSIIRTTDTVTTGRVEGGNIRVKYDGGASSTNKWGISQSYDGDALVTFTMTDAGQVQYAVTALAGSSYSGTMKFRAITLPI